MLNHATIRIIQNLYEMGCIKMPNYMREDNKEEALTIPLNHDYKIKMYRKTAIKWKRDQGYSYVCFMTFLNNLDHPIIELRLSENEVLGLLDSFSQAAEFGVNDICFPLSTPIAQAPEQYYMICINRNIVDHPSEEDTSIYFSIRQYSKLTEQVIPRFVTKIDYDLFFDDICYLIYFAYIIDIDDGTSGYFYHWQS